MAWLRCGKRCTDPVTKSGDASHACRPSRIESPEATAPHALVPAANPTIRAFNAVGNQIPAAPASGSVNYTIDANAFVPGSAGQSELQPIEHVDQPLRDRGSYRDCGDAAICGLSMRICFLSNFFLSRNAAP